MTVKTVPHPAHRDANTTRQTESISRHHLFSIRESKFFPQHQTKDPINYSSTPDTVANLASLTDSLNDMYLQDMNLEEQQRSGEQQIDFHELKMEYPVLDLLPVDEPVTPF
jgi:hypothetical protein